MKKMLALLLALVMVLALAACGQQAAPAPAANEPAPASNDAPAPAAAEPVTLKIWFHGSNVSPEASKKVLDELNVYLNDKIGNSRPTFTARWARRFFILAAKVP